MTSTTTNPASPPPVPGPTEPAVVLVSTPRVSRLWWVAGPLLGALVAAITVIMAMPVPYMAVMPGSARSVEPLIEVSAVDGGPAPEVEDPRDGLLFVTVSSRQPSGIEALWRSVWPGAGVEVVPERVMLGTQSRDEARTFNLALMTGSKDKATKVALERAGYEVGFTPSGAVVVDLGPEFPSARVLQPGDTVVEADGSAVTTAEDLVAAIAARAPGDTMELVVERLGEQEPRTVEAPLVTNPETGAAQLGVSIETRPTFDFPVEVTIESGDVGGPSAGLAFTIAILDRLTEGDLTGEATVAVTGTIELDGRVGPVGGVTQKTEAALGEGATVFIVPPQEYEAAVEAARGRLLVRQAATIDEAIDVLSEVGGDPLIPAAQADRGGGAGG